MHTRANRLHTSAIHWASRPGWGGGKNSTSKLICWFWVDLRAGDFFTRQNVTERQVLARADRLSQQDECAVGAHHFGPGPFGKCGAIGLLAMHDDSHTRKDALAPPLAWGISGPRAGRARNPPSFYGEWHAWQEPNVAPEWSCCLAFGFTAVSGCGLSAEVRAVARLLRRHLYEEALTCLAARVLRCACAGA